MHMERTGGFGSVDMVCSKDVTKCCPDDETCCQVIARKATEGQAALDRHERITDLLYSPEPCHVVYLGKRAYRVARSEDERKALFKREILSLLDVGPLTNEELRLLLLIVVRKLL